MQHTYTIYSSHSYTAIQNLYTIQFPIVKETRKAYLIKCVVGGVLDVSIYIGIRTATIRFVAKTLREIYNITYLCIYRAIPNSKFTTGKVPRGSSI